MHYDLSAIESLSKRLGFPCAIDSTGLRACITLNSQAALCFQNAGRDEDCLVGFEGTPWHSHDELMFVGPTGLYVEVGPLELLPLLASGRILIMQQWQDGQLIDQSLIHAEFNDEFRYVSLGEELRVSRALSTL